MIAMTKPKAQTTTESSAQLPSDFEHAYAELENIVAQMESGQMPLETSLTAYQRGNTLLQYCQKSLSDVAQQVQILNAENQLLQFKSQDNQ